MLQRIFSPMSTVERICAGQQYLKGESYRMTVHCLEIPCGDGTLLYHTLTGALYLLSTGDTTAAHEEELVKNRFMVPLAFDESAYVLQVRRILSMLRPFDGKKTSFTILTTTDCNARCFYCYELGCKKLTMSEKVAADTARYIAGVSGGEKVKLSWFGGEPLYNARAIDIICTALGELGVKYKSSIVSNGYLFDEETVKRAKELWKLESAQITVDGTKERYQKTKAYIYHDDCAYENVMKNIGTLLSYGIKVTVRLNMNRENYEDLFLLADELEHSFGGRERFSVYPVLLKEFVGKVGAFSSDDEAVEKYLALKDKLAEKGVMKLSGLERNITFHRCMADNDSCEVIKPDGTIGKCEHFDESDVIGTIYTDVRDGDMISSWKEQVTEEKCFSCSLFPRCIELKRCAWSKDGCTETVRRLRTIKLKDMVLDEYIKTKNRGEES